MFSLNQEFSNMFKEEAQFHKEINTWDSAFINTKEKFLINKLNEYDEEHAHSFESTKIYQTKSKSISSVYSENTKPVQIAGESQDIMKSFDI